MKKLTRNQKLVAEKIEAGKFYSLREASELVKEITTTKFEASVDIDMRLGVDPRKAKQKRLVPTMWDSRNISTKSRVVGPTLMSSLLCLRAWVRWVLSDVSLVHVD